MGRRNSTKTGGGREKKKKDTDLELKDAKGKSGPKRLRKVAEIPVEKRENAREPVCSKIPDRKVKKKKKRKEVGERSEGWVLRSVKSKRDCQGFCWGTMEGRWGKEYGQSNMASYSIVELEETCEKKKIDFWCAENGGSCRADKFHWGGVSPNAHNLKKKEEKSRPMPAGEKPFTNKAFQGKEGCRGHGWVRGKQV